ncbi:cobalamin B12-binding domain-containing protein [Aurantiacibacter odishensis]|uniref:cobalamin B12-binding domain-containing protein n=1 Tax=Aurantiacibacter odishensis TaxID=1155476 RepID=UPI0013C50EA5|nr:cobalamin-dependent protein [Aurantiacibacter odishensis]
MTKDTGCTCSSPEPGRELDLNKLVSSTIIPHLLLLQPETPAQSGAPQDDVIDPHEVQQFPDLALTLEANELLGLVEAFLARGVSVESIFIELLAPTARRLGEMWEEDTCDFVDVTMGLWRLQEILRSVAQSSPALIDNALAPRSILISPMPGDQHSFGALMVEEVFARAGWASEVLLEPKRRELLAYVNEQAFDIVGLTLSNDCPSDTLSEFITCLRSVSKNPNLIVLLGGRLVNSQPAIATKAGADGTATDARSALHLAEQLLATVRPLATASN